MGILKWIFSVLLYISVLSIPHNVEGAASNSNYFRDRLLGPFFNPHEIICPIEGTETFPSENCREFIQCDEGQPIVHECPDDLYYNPATHECDFPSNVPECVGGTRPPPPTQPPTTTTTEPSTTTTTTEPTTTTTTTEQTTTAEPTPTTEPTTTTTTTEPTTTTERTTTMYPVPDCPPYEVGDHPVFFPGISCDTYFMCAEGRPILMTCPRPLLWDQRILTCNNPGSVVCDM